MRGLKIKFISQSVFGFSLLWLKHCRRDIKTNYNDANKEVVNAAQVRQMSFGRTKVVKKELPKG